MIKEFLILIRIVNSATKLIYSSVNIYVVVFVILLVIPCLLVLVPISLSHDIYFIYLLMAASTFDPNGSLSSTQRSLTHCLTDKVTYCLSCPGQLKTQIHL